MNITSVNEYDGNFMNVNLKIRIKIISFRKKKVPQKFKTCNSHSVKKTIFFFFFGASYYYYYFLIKDESLTF